MSPYYKYKFTSDIVITYQQNLKNLWPKIWFHSLLYYVLEYGTILKALATTNKSLQGCYLEEMQLHPPGVKEPILSLQILHGDRTLFVGLNDRVLKIPLARCSSYKTEQ